MRRFLLVIVAVGGCDTIWRLDTVHDHAADAPPVGDGPQLDAPDDGGSVGSLRIMLPASQAVWVGDQVALQAFVHGPANAPVLATASAVLGSIAPPTASLTLDGNGIAPFDVIYTAPSTAGQDMLTFGAKTGMLTAASTLPLNVAPLTSVGIDTAQAAHQPISASDAIGAKITLSSGGSIRKVGFWASSAGAHVRVGVYTVDPGAGGPLALQTADLAAHAVVAGRNEIDVAPVTVIAGTYWMVAVFDGSTEVQYTTMGIYGTASHAYGPMPQMWPSSPTWIDVANTTFAFFLRIGM